MTDPRSYGEVTFSGDANTLAAELQAAGVDCEVRESFHVLRGCYVRVSIGEFGAMFEQVPDDGDYLIHCETETVAGGRAALGALSRAMTSRDFRHRFELYDEEKLIGYYHHRWPA